jgi:hypothetical protein
MKPLNDESLITGKAIYKGMKSIAIKLTLILLIGISTGCSIFKPGCKCPKVSYNSYPQR